MHVMDTFDFTSVPVMGKLMSATGISDGWVIISALLLVFALIFLIGWILSASKGRTARKQIEEMEREILGLQALTNLPPLRDDDWEYAEGADPGSSLVFTSARDLKRLRKAQAAVATENKADLGKTEAMPAVPQKKAAKKEGSDSVTAQVHKAIFASVSNSHKEIADKPKTKVAQGGETTNNRKRKPNGAFITSSDLPPIHVDENGTPKPGKVKKKPVDIDASLSSRIPRL